MVQKEVEAIQNEDSTMSTQNSSNKALQTAKEFRVHTLKSNDDKE